MPEEMVPVTRTKEIKPEGAAEDAAAFRAVAHRCRAFRGQLRGLHTNLENVWEGQSKERFFHDYGFTATPVDMDLLAEWLEEQARRINGRTVTIEYTVLVSARPTWK
jgi:uncharacterized protein YukE